MDKRIESKIEAKTPNQKVYLESIHNNKITFCNGPAGTGKTFLPTITGLCGLLEDKYEKLIISRPLVQSDYNSGYLPGSLDEKLAPYIKPITDILEFSLAKKDLDNLIRSKRIEVIPFGYMRGLTFYKSYIIFEECQNCSYDQLVLGLTRFGRNCKMILSGDITQSDLSKDKRGGFETMLDKLRNVKDVGIIQLDTVDIIREPIIKTILETLG